MLRVLIRIDELGERPVVVAEHEDGVAPSDEARWRYVCEVETREEGQRVCDAWLTARARGSGQGGGVAG